MSQNVERHSIVPRRPVLKCEDRYKLIEACKKHSYQINSNLLGFINMHPVHEELVPFYPTSSIIDTKEICFIQNKPLVKDNIMNDCGSLKGTLGGVMESEDIFDILKEQKNNEVRETDEMILTISKEPKTYLKKINTGATPTNKKAFEITYKSIEDNVCVDKIEKFPSKIKGELAPSNESSELNVLPVCMLTQNTISGLKSQKNIKFLPTLKLKKDTMKILSRNISGQNISLKNRPTVNHLTEAKKTGKTPLKAKVKLVAKISELNIKKKESSTKPVITKAPAVQTPNLQGKKIVIVTKNDNIMLKPLTSLSNSKTIIERQPVKSMETLNDHNKQIGGLKSNIPIKKFFLTGSSHIEMKNLNLRTDNEENDDKIVRMADNVSCGNHGKQIDKKFIEVPLKDDYNELNATGNKEIKLVNNINKKKCSEKEFETDFNMENVSDTNVNKGSFDKDGSEKKSDDTESNYSLIMEGNLSKDAITEIILGRSSHNLPKGTPEGIITETNEEKVSETPSESRKCQITSSNCRNNYKPLKSIPDDGIAVETEGKGSKTPSEASKCQITSSNCKNYYKPSKSVPDDGIAIETEEKGSKTSSVARKCQITSSNCKNYYKPPKSIPDDGIAVETEEKDSKTSSEVRKRQNTSMNDTDSFNNNENNKRLCLSDKVVNKVREKPNDNEIIKSPIENNTNKANNTRTADFIGYSSTYQNKHFSDMDASDIENPKQTVLDEMDWFDSEIENFDVLLKDIGKFDNFDLNMQLELSSWNSLLIDEDISDETVKSGNHMGQNKLLHMYHRRDPFLIQTENKPKYRKWQLMFFLDMKKSLRKDFAGNMPIHEAVLKDDMKMLHKQCLALLARVKTVDVRNNDGSTPLHLAILNRLNPDTISILLKFNASVTATDNDGNNAFHLAAYSSDVEYVRRLLECSNVQQARSDVANFDGLTPLMISVLNNDYVIVEQLLLGRFSPNVRDQKSGRTALFYAVEQNNERLVKLLLSHGGDTRIENFFGTSTHDAVYELSNVKTDIKLLIHEKKRLEKIKKNKSTGSPKIPLSINNSRSPGNHVNNLEERNYRTYGVQCKRSKLEPED